MFRKPPKIGDFFNHFSKTTVPNVLKFLVELDFSHGSTQKISGHLDKVTITLMRVTGEFAFDVQGSVYSVQQSVQYKRTVYLDFD